MKLARINVRYPVYLQGFYSQRPGLADKSYAEQKAVLAYHNAYGTDECWVNALEPLGYDVLTVDATAEPEQRAWARENGLPDNTGVADITFQQIKRFKPEVLWYNHHDAGLLARIRSDIPSIRLVLAWTGSPVRESEAWKYTDLVLSCAPENVEYLLNAGIRCEHMDHAFHPPVLDRINMDSETSINLSFIGSLVRVSRYHLERERLLEHAIMKLKGVELFSPSAETTHMDEFRALAAMGVYEVMAASRAIGISHNLIKTLPLFNRVAHLDMRPMWPVNPKLRHCMKPPVFGLEMYQTLRDSKTTLNIHADSSPTHASNLRLFEATGVGTCLVTDWKQNLHKLFEPEKEVVTYKSADECVEKVSWLLDHPKERNKIARAGHERCMKEHTFSHRADELNEIIHRELHKTKPHGG